jgi:plasmid stability protein
MARKDSDIRPLTARIPEGLRRRLEKEAARKSRSMNAEIINRLQRSFDLEQTDALVAGLTGNQDNATLLRLLATAALLVGHWKGDDLKAEALRVAIDRIVSSYAGLKRHAGGTLLDDYGSTQRKSAAVHDAEISGQSIARAVIVNAGLADILEALPVGEST